MFNTHTHTHTHTHTYIYRALPHAQHTHTCTHTHARARTSGRRCSGRPKRNRDRGCGPISVEAGADQDSNVHTQCERSVRSREVPVPIRTPYVTSLSVNRRLALIRQALLTHVSARELNWREERASGKTSLMLAAVHGHVDCAKVRFPHVRHATLGFQGGGGAPNTFYTFSAQNHFPSARNTHPTFPSS